VDERTRARSLPLSLSLTRTLLCASQCVQARVQQARVRVLDTQVGWAWRKGLCTAVHNWLWANA